MVGAAATIEYARYRGTQKGRYGTISPEEQASTERRAKVETSLTRRFGEEAKDPFKYTMDLDRQQTFDTLQQRAFDEQRKGQQQQLLGQMSGRGTLASGATNYRLMRFGQQTMQQQGQQYLSDVQSRFQERQGGIENVTGQGAQILGAPAIGTQQTELMNARARQHNEWRNRWATRVANMGMF